MRKILIDLGGCDRPEQLLEGVLTAAEECPDVRLIAAVRGEEHPDTDAVEWMCCPTEIASGEPADTVLTRRDCTLVRALTRLKEDPEAVGMISAGNTGALLAGSAAFLGRLPGVGRPALASLLPTETGGMVCLLDCGANVDCKPQVMPAFAVMGGALMTGLYGIARPRVAAVSVGTERGKGNAFTREVCGLLENVPGIDFVGNMEACDALSGRYDVLVCDGFVGNVLLKSIEGAAKFAVRTMAATLSAESGDRALTGTVVEAAMQKLDYTGRAGAVLLGTGKPVVKAHGAAGSGTVP